MKSTIFRRLLFFAIVLFSVCTAHAQVVSPESPAYELFKDASETNPITIEYEQTPDFCFGYQRRNVFTKFNRNQLQVLSDYSYPKFTSHGLVMLEADIMVFKSEVKTWELANRDKETEIQAALGFN